MAGSDVEEGVVDVHGYRVFGPDGVVVLLDVGVVQVGSSGSGEGNQQGEPDVANLWLMDHDWLVRRVRAAIQE